MSDPRKFGTRFQRGFTLVELIMTMVIVGILAVMAAPRFTDSDAFQSRGFADQVQATLRHAQKIAIAQHRFVCVAFDANSVTLTYDPTAPSTSHTAATCPGSNLTGTTGQTPYAVTAPSGVTLSGGTSFNFDAQGKPSAAQNISVSGYGTPITIEAGTGYVH
jgi:MSHA pilin protein MshC